MKRLFNDLLCAVLGHRKSYIEFGVSRIPYSCKRCGKMWNAW